MKNFVAIVLISLVVCYGCNSGTANDTATPVSVKDRSVGEIKIYDSTALKLIDSNAIIQIIARGFKWAEGPVWIADKQMLLFTDVPENKIYQWKPGYDAKLYLTPSGYTDSIKRNGGEDGANGLALDNDGALLLCQSGNRQVVKMNAPIDSPKPVFTVLSARFANKRFNSPNDLAVNSKGDIYFTDPIYGLPKGADDLSRESAIEGVYKINAKGETSLLIDSIPNPNGIAVSADQKILYVASSDGVHPKWYAYKLDGNGNIQSGGVLLDGTELQEMATVKQGADGFKLDKYGNIFSAGPDGINIISPDGVLLALIKIYTRRTSNCAFNKTKDVLYITANDVVLEVKLRK